MRRFPGFGALALVGLAAVETASFVTEAVSAASSRLERHEIATSSSDDDRAQPHVLRAGDGVQLRSEAVSSTASHGPAA